MVIVALWVRDRGIYRRFSEIVEAKFTDLSNIKYKLSQGEEEDSRDIQN